MTIDNQKINNLITDNINSEIDNRYENFEEIPNYSNSESVIVYNYIITLLKSAIDKEVIIDNQINLIKAAYDITNNFKDEINPSKSLLENLESEVVNWLEEKIDLHIAIKNLRDKINFNDFFKEYIENVLKDFIKGITETFDKTLDLVAEVIESKNNQISKLVSSLSEVNIQFNSLFKNIEKLNVDSIEKISKDFGENKEKNKDKQLEDYDTQSDFLDNIKILEEFLGYSKKLPDLKKDKDQIETVNIYSPDYKSDFKKIDNIKEKNVDEDKPTLHKNNKIKTLPLAIRRISEQTNIISFLKKNLNSSNILIKKIRHFNLGFVNFLSTKIKSNLELSENISSLVFTNVIDKKPLFLRKTLKIDPIKSVDDKTEHQKTNLGGFGGFGKIAFWITSIAAIFSLAFLSSETLTIGAGRFLKPLGLELYTVGSINSMLAKKIYSSSRSLKNIITSSKHFRSNKNLRLLLSRLSKFRRFKLTSKFGKLTNNLRKLSPANSAIMKTAGKAIFWVGAAVEAVGHIVADPDEWHAKALGYSKEKYKLLKSRGMISTKSGGIARISNILSFGETSFSNAISFGFTLGGIGAKIGTLIAPGIGTAIGAGIGFALGIALNFIGRERIFKFLTKAEELLSSTVMAALNEVKRIFKKIKAAGLYIADRIQDSMIERLFSRNLKLFDKSISRFGLISNRIILLYSTTFKKMTEFNQYLSKFEAVVKYFKTNRKSKRLKIIFDSFINDYYLIIDQILDFGNGHIEKTIIKIDNEIKSFQNLKFSKTDKIKELTENQQYELSELIRKISSNLDSESLSEEISILSNLKNINKISRFINDKNEDLEKEETTNVAYYFNTDQPGFINNEAKKFAALA